MKNSVRTWEVASFLIPTLMFGFMIGLWIGVLVGHRTTDTWWKQHARLLTTEVFVSPSGDDLNNCLTKETACLTIFHALTQLDGAGVISVSDGFIKYDHYAPVCSNERETNDGSWEFCGIWLRKSEVSKANEKQN